MDISAKRRFILTCAAACLLSTPALAGGTTWSIGTEGFYGDYKETSLNNEGKTDAGSLTGYFEHSVTKRTFVAVDGRASYGTEDFSSPDGSIDAIPQWEFELRGRVGMTFPVWGGEMSPYIGLGWRYTMSEGKGYTTEQGYEDYDRDTSQYYVPIGASYHIGFGDGWSVTPQAEADLMFYGNADSRVTNVVNGGFVSSACSPSCLGYQLLNPASNDQHFGIGGRGQLMIGKNLGGYTIQGGPFVRYWYVPASDAVTFQGLNSAPNVNYTVPKNTDLETGIGLSVLF